jgi:hypothetical protein
MKLFEGGNVFKDANGQSLTQRIDQRDILSTVNWLEALTGLNFTNDITRDGYPTRWLGSTGRKPTSGDLDLAVDLKEISKLELKSKLEQWAKSQQQKPEDWVRMSGEAVHFRTPITGDERNGFVQTDFMFMPNMKWGVFWLSSSPDSNYKGLYRNVLMSSLAKASNLKASNRGITDRSSGEILTTDPQSAAELLLYKGASVDDLSSVEKIYSALSRDPQRNQKLSDFREYLAKDGLQEPGLMQENDVNFLARLRDRIVNRGMLALVEAEQPESPAMGGRAKGIEHLEDYVFRKGTAGIRQAIAIAQQASDQPHETVTAKWDGKPAVIFGRKPSNGEFVLTDGSGFDARGYDGLATSPAMMGQIQNSRGPGRENLIAIYAKLFPILDAALPRDFRGYVKGDLLYTNTPPEINGAYEFQPNEVKYRIPVNSPLGQRIGNSNVGIAMHSLYDDQGSPRQPLKNFNFNNVPGLMLEKPVSVDTLTLDKNIVKKLNKIVNNDGSKINNLFNPMELRANKITDFAKLAIDFVNTKVGTELNRNTLVLEFLKWLSTGVTASKYQNILNYLRSQPQHVNALAAAFEAFNLLHDLKVDIQQQGDRAHPGQEGWVLATPAGYAKAVGRFNPQAFAALNRARNNPPK